MDCQNYSFENLNFEKYADFVINFPILFIRDEDTYISGKKYIFKDFMDGKINEIGNRTTQDLICRILPQVSSANIPLVGTRDVKNRAIIVITSDRGFAGSFNSSVIRLAEKEIEKFGKDKVQVFCLGKKASEYFSKRNYNVVQSFYDFWKDMTFDTASNISETFIGAFNNLEVDEVHVIYNRFRTLASQDLMIEKVLPIDFTEDYNVKNYNYDYEPNQERIVESLLPKHLKVQMWQQMLESYSSEEAARMIAMDNATENAKEIN